MRRSTRRRIIVAVIWPFAYTAALVMSVGTPMARPTAAMSHMRMSDMAMSGAPAIAAPAPGDAGAPIGLAHYGPCNHGPCTCPATPTSCMCCTFSLSPALPPLATSVALVPPRARTSWHFMRLAPASLGAAPATPPPKTPA